MGLIDDLAYITYDKYIFAVVILLFLIVFVKFALIFARKYLLRLAKKTKTEIDDQIIIRGEKPVFVTLMFVAIRVALIPLDLGGEYGFFVSRIFDSILILCAAYVIHTVTTVILEHYVHKINRHTVSSFHSEMIPFTNHGSKIIYAILAFVFILRIWDVNVTPVLAGLGIVGIAVGLAMQNTLLNIIGGIAVLLDRNFNLGDEIHIDPDVEGTIIDVGLRSTKIRTYNNELLFIPNNVLANSRIINYAKPTTHVKIGIEFSVKATQLRKVEKKIIGMVKNHSFVEGKSEIVISSIGETTKAVAYFDVNLSRITRRHAKDQLSELVFDCVET